MRQCLQDRRQSAKKRVCIIRRAYYPAESHVRRNAETLLEAGYEVTLLCLQNKGEAKLEVVSGIEVHRLPLKAKRSNTFWYLFEYLLFFFMVLFAITRLELKNHFDFVEADSMPNFLIFTAILPRLRRARLILYLFESMPELWMQKLGLERPNFAIRLLMLEEKISCYFPQALICCHDLAKQALVGRNIPSTKITTLLNVPDEKVYRFRVRHPQNRPGLHLVQHGTITENYGIQVVLKALSLLEPDILIHYDVIGAGEYQPFLEKMAADLKITGRVTFHGFIAREDLLKLLENSDVGIVPMLFEYQSPNKLFEFIALGLPVIASDKETFKQHFTEKELFYFKTEDAEDLARVIKKVHDNPELLAAISDRGYKRFASYRWKNMKKIYLDLYIGLGNEKSARPQNALH